MSVTRRRSTRDDEPDEDRPSRRSRDEGEDREERGSRRNTRSRDRDDEPEKERPSRGRRTRSRDNDEDERPSRGSRRGPSSRDTDEDKPSRSRSRGRSEDEGGRSRRRGTSGFGSYSSKKRSSGDYAEDFKPGANKKTLIKILDEEPFDSYNQHWIDDMPKGERKSYVCLDDEEYFGSSDCPLCEIGEKAKTFALFNILDLSNPRKPEVRVWSASPAVADYLERASEESKTSPISRDDLYWEVELTKKGSRYAWVLTPVKARDLPDDFDMDPLEEDEIDEFLNDLFEDRSAVTKVDSFNDLQELADDLMK